MYVEYEVPDIGFPSGQLPLLPKGKNLYMIQTRMSNHWDEGYCAIGHCKGHFCG